MIQWTEDLATGVAEIDAQHQGLYATVAALHEAMRSHRLDLVASVIASLEDYAVDHFATEERWMEATRYPGFHHHRSAHRAFAREFAERKSLFHEIGPKPSFVVELSSWLADWLRDHVRSLDRELGAHLRAASD